MKDIDNKEGGDRRWRRERNENRESKGYKSNEKEKRGEIKIDMIEGGARGEREREQCDDIEERKKRQIEERGNER